MSKKGVIIFILSLVIVFGGLYAVSLHTQPTLDVTDPELPEFEVLSQDIVQGNKEADTVLVLFGNYNCPNTAAVMPEIEQLVNDMPDDLAFVYRHMNNPRLPDDQLAARSAEAAAKQEAFWDMHYLIMERGPEWQDVDEPEAVFTELADELELDVEQFENDLQSREVAIAVENDRRIASDLGLQNTPAMFLNGRPVDNLPELLNNILDATGATTQDGQDIDQLDGRQIELDEDGVPTEDIEIDMEPVNDESGIDEDQEDGIQLPIVE